MDTLAYLTAERAAIFWCTLEGGLLASAMIIHVMRHASAHRELAKVLARMESMRGPARFAAQLRDFGIFVEPLGVMKKLWGEYLSFLYLPPAHSASSNVRSGIRAKKIFRPERFTAEYVGHGVLKRASLCLGLVPVLGGLATVATGLLAAKGQIPTARATPWQTLLEAGLGGLAVLATGLVAVGMYGVFTLAMARLPRRRLEQITDIIDQSVKLTSVAEQLTFQNLEMQNQAISLSLIERRLEQLGDTLERLPKELIEKRKKTKSTGESSRKALPDAAKTLEKSARKVVNELSDSFSEATEDMNREIESTYFAVVDGSVPPKTKSLVVGNTIKGHRDSFPNWDEITAIQEKHPGTKPYFAEMANYLDMMEAYIETVSNSGRQFQELRRQAEEAPRRSPTLGRDDLYRGYVEASQVAGEIKSVLGRLSSERIKLDKVWESYVEHYESLDEAARKALAGPFQKVRASRERIAASGQAMQATMTKKLTDLMKSMDS